MSLLCLLIDLDIIVVCKCNATNKPYEFIVSRSNVLATLEFKMSNDPYYKDVQISLSGLNVLPLQPTDVSPLLRHATTSGLGAHIPSSLDDDAPPSLSASLNPQTSSFIYAPPNSQTESKEIRCFVTSNSRNPTP